MTNAKGGTPLEKSAPFIFNTDNTMYRFHVLKTVQPYFDAVESGEKTLEIRKFDRDFQVGDYLLLVEYYLDSDADRPVGTQLKTIIRRITHVMTHEDHEGIKEGFIAMSLTAVSPQEEQRINLLSGAEYLS